MLFRYKIYLLFFLPSLLNGQDRKWVFQAPKMGSLFAIQAYAQDSVKVALAAQKAFEAVDSLNHIFSDYDSTSELSKLSATAGLGQWIGVSPALFSIIKTSKMAWQKSNEGFDISLGRLSILWRNARKTMVFPSKKAIANALATAGMESILIDEKEQKVKLLKQGTRLDLGGIGKGYAAQTMLEIMQKEGFGMVLCDAAGNMAIGQKPPNKEGWLIGIGRSKNLENFDNNLLTLSNIAVSTSGDMFQFFEHKGQRFSHIINPKTGLGLQSQRQVSIVCANATTADWLSTACSVLPIKKSKLLAQKMKAKILIFERGK